MNTDSEIDALATRIANKIFKKQRSQMEEKGLTSQDHEMFRKALKAYAKTEQELSEVRCKMLRGEELPDEYKDKRPTVQTSKAKRGRASSKVSSDKLSAIAEAIRSL